MTDSHFVRHEPCPSCGSKNNLARYSDGHAVCFTGGCDHYERGNGEVVESKPKANRKLEMTGVVASIPTFLFLKSRNYSKNSLSVDYSCVW